VAFGRLSLFGDGATRLHEELIAVAAQVTADGLRSFGAAGEATTLERLGEALAYRPRPHPSDLAHRTVCGRATRDFTSLWTRLREQATAAAEKARAALEARGQREASDMVALLERQRAAIKAQFTHHGQLSLGLSKAAQEEREQFERDARFMNARLSAIDTELQSEPELIRGSYAVALERFEPVGMAYLWPGS